MDLASQPYPSTVEKTPDAQLTPKAIYQAEFPYVWNSLRRLGAKGAELDDLAQEVFLRVFRNFASYDDTRPLRPWLFSIANRVFSDHRQLHRHTREVFVDADAADSAPGPAEQLETRRARELVSKAMDGIAEDRRPVFVMFEIAGHTMPEIAEALQLPLPTAYSRLRLARVEFAEAVQKLTEGSSDGARR
jgi:RNA polymerase sigma-70 factor (ECF subfamily)